MEIVWLCIVPKRIETRKIMEQIKNIIFDVGAVEGLKYQEIAHALGISVNTVKTQMKFAYRKVKSQVGSEMNVLIVMFWLSSRYFWILDWKNRFCMEIFRNIPNRIETLPEVQ